MVTIKRILRKIWNNFAHPLYMFPTNVVGEFDISKYDRKICVRRLCFEVLYTWMQQKPKPSKFHKKEAKETKQANLEIPFVSPFMVIQPQGNGTTLLVFIKQKCAVAHHIYVCIWRASIVNGEGPLFCFRSVSTSTHMNMNQH